MKAESKEKGQPIVRTDRNYTLSVLKKIVSVDSVNPEMDPDSDGEIELSIALEDTLEKLGLDVEIQQVKSASPKKRQNVIGKQRLRQGRKTGSSKTLMIHCHIDTVPTSGMTIKPFVPVVRDGYLYGRGTTDIKGGVAAAVS